MLAAYTVVGELGRGGMGRVLRVRHKATGIERALKVLDGVSGVEAVERFRREAEALARAAGAGAVPIHETGLERGSLYYVMDLMPGGSLRDRVRSGAKLPWEEAAALVARIARMVDRCHAVGLIHRDLKPENVLFDDSGGPRLADFGCVRDTRSRSLTEAGEVLGTLAYMSPEQLNGRRVDAKTDVFALGVILHELVAGARPFAGRTWAEIALAVGQGQRRSLVEVSDAPEALEEVARAALAADASARSTAAELATALDAVLRGESVAAPPRRALIVLGALLLAATGIATGWFAARRSQPVDSPTHADPSPVASHDDVSFVMSVAPVRPPDPQVIATKIRRADEAVAELAGIFEYTSTLTDARRIDKVALDANAALRDLERVAPTRLPETLAPVTTAARAFVRVGARGPRVASIIDKLQRALEGLPRDRMPPGLALCRYLLEDRPEPVAGFTIAKARGYAAEVRKRAAAVTDDPYLVDLALRDVAECLSWTVVPDNDEVRAVTEEILALDREIVRLDAAASDPEDVQALQHHERRRYDVLRDVYFWRSQFGRGDREADARAAIEAAKNAPRFRAVDGSGDAEVAQCFRTLLELEPRSDETKEYLEAHRSLESHVLYPEYVRTHDLAPERAIAAARKLAPEGMAAALSAWREDPTARLDPFKLSTPHDLLAVEANALVDLGRLDEAAALESDLARLEAIAVAANASPGGVLRSMSSLAIDARIAAARKKR